MSFMRVCFFSSFHSVPSFLLTQNYLLFNLRSAFFPTILFVCATTLLLSFYCYLGTTLVFHLRHRYFLLFCCDLWHETYTRTRMHTHTPYHTIPHTHTAHTERHTQSKQIKQSALTQKRNTNKYFYE